MGQSLDWADHGGRRRARVVAVALTTALLPLVGLVSYGVLTGNRHTTAPRSRLDKDIDQEDERPGVSTGTESIWDVKVGTDAQARLVRLQPVPTTVAWLVSQTHTSPNHRIAPVELTTYTVTATLTDIHQEHDLDQKLEIEDDAGHHMLAELPDVSLSTTSVFAAQIKHAHQELAAWHGDVPTRVEVTGVGFFDEPTGQSEQAPNEIELHPILDLRFPTPSP
ncbi:MAG TPA: hypothetical protein VIB48_23340 [Acidimicrobiia bacterium]|jgi:hypothetical protein